MPERHLGASLGRFRVDAIIGSGGFAWVYKGYDPELGIPVAIKVLKPQFAGDENFESRFRREASTAAKLRHPNIVRILAVGRENAAVYFVMDFLPHGLVDRLRVMGTFPDHLLIRLGMDVAAALAFAHREGVIHRDIKTDNILFDEHGNAVVADFGIARAVSGYTNQTGTNMVVGTPQYFSPEQARGLALDGRADLYSLGVTLYKAATGVLPFQGADWYEIARQHVEDEPPRPRSFNPAISRSVEKLILKCLAKDVEMRYSSAEALYSDLVQLQSESADTTGQRTVMLATPSGQEGLYVNQRSGLFSALRNRLPSRPAGFALLGAGLALLLVVGLSRGLGDSRNPVAVPATPVEVLPSEPPIQTPPPPSAASLRVMAPPSAAVRLNGIVVGRGAWRADTLRPGVYMVSATIQSANACSADRDSARVILSDTGGASRVTLSPRGCGILVLDATPAGGAYVLSSMETGRGRQADLRGTVTQVSARITLTAGQYRLTISAPYCADFRGDLAIVRKKTHLERVRLICG